MASSDARGRLVSRLALLSLPKDLLQRIILFVPQQWLASVTLTSRQCAFCVSGDDDTPALWRLRRSEECCNGFLADGLAVVLGQVRHNSQTVFSTGWVTLQPFAAHETDPIRNEREDCFESYRFTRRGNIALPREGDFPVQYRALSLLILDAVADSIQHRFAHQGIGFIMLTPCAIRVMMAAYEWYICAVHVANSSDSGVYNEDEHAVTLCSYPCGLRRPSQARHLSMQDLTDAMKLQVPTSLTKAKLVAAFVEKVGGIWFDGFAHAWNNYGIAHDDAGKWALPNGIFFPHFAHFVDKETRCVGPVPQILMTAADLLHVLEVATELWPVASPKFARTVVAEIVHELQAERPVLCDLAEAQFADTNNRTPIVQRYLDALRSHDGIATFVRLPERHCSHPESESDTESESAEFTDGESDNSNTDSDSDQWSMAASDYDV